MDKTRNQERKTKKGVETLLGNPKKAIVRLAIPMMVGMLVQTLYNLVDGIWVAGIGSNALAAIGLFFPFYMSIIAIAAGLGVGASSAISRRIGAKDANGADNVAQHGLFLTVITAIALTALTLPFLRQIFGSFGSGKNVVILATNYSRILFSGSIMIMFAQVGSGILRGEGDTQRAMIAMLVGSLLNIGLDPLFIYTFKLGVAGAAWATVISLTLSAMMILYWLLFKKDTYVQINLKDFKYDSKILGEILKVGLPSSLAQFSMALAMFGLNFIIIKASGDNGMAVFTGSWRVIMLGIVPLLGMAIATTAVTGAAFGAKKPEKMKIAYLYSVKLGIFVELVVSVLILVFVKPITSLFTYSNSAKLISSDMVSALRILVWTLPFTPLGMLTSSLFQGIGDGYKSLTVTILRTVVMQILFAYLFVFVFHLGLSGVWWGIVTGNIIAAMIAFTWGLFTVYKRHFVTET